MRKDAKALVISDNQDELVDSPRFKLTHWLVFCGVFCASAFIINTLPREIKALLAEIGFAVSTLAGVIFLVLGLSNLFKKKPASGMIKLSQEMLKIGGRNGDENAQRQSDN